MWVCGELVESKRKARENASLIALWLIANQLEAWKQWAERDREKESKSEKKSRKLNHWLLSFRGSRLFQRSLFEEAKSGWWEENGKCSWWKGEEALCPLSDRQVIERPLSWGWLDRDKGPLSGKGRNGMACVWEREREGGIRPSVP